ncbi:MAG: hypothetical protein ACI4WW_05210 [Candidatus Coprovivens sp.]
MGKRFNIAPLIMILLFIAVIGMGVYIFIDYKKDIEHNTVPSYLSKVINVDNTKDISSVIKEYSYDNNLAVKDNIKLWNIDSIKYIGKLENDDLHYYRVDGTYSCKDESSNCVYVSQVSDVVEGKYEYHVYVTLRNDKDGYKLVDISSQVETVTDVVNDNNEGVRGTGYTYDELVEVYKDFMISKGMVMLPDLNEWNVTLRYVGKVKDSLVFYASNIYTCLSGSNTCIYQSQVGETPNAFEIALFMDKDIDGIYKFTSIDLPFNIVLDETAMEEDIDSNVVTRTGMAGKIKDFYISTGVAVEDNLKKFDVSYVTYLGDLKSNASMYGMKATITYACNDGMKTCVLEDVKRDPSSKDYTFSVAFDVMISETGEYNVVQIYPVGSNEHININNIVLK